MPGHQKAGEKRTHQSRSGPYKEQSDAQKIHVVVRTKPSRQFDSSPLTSLSTLYPPVNADSRALAGRLNYNSKGQQAQGTLRMAASLRTKGLQWRSAAAPLPALPSCSTAKEHTDVSLTLCIYTGQAAGLKDSAWRGSLVKPLFHACTFANGSSLSAPCPCSFQNGRLHHNIRVASPRQALRALSPPFAMSSAGPRRFPVGTPQRS